MRPTPPSNHTHMLCLDKKRSLTGTETQVKPCIGSYLRRVATNVVVLSVFVRLSVHNISYISGIAINIFLKLVLRRYMYLNVIMFFSRSVFLCYVPAPYLLNDWKLIKEMSKARILVVGW